MQIDHTRREVLRNSLWLAAGAAATDNLLHGQASQTSSSGKEEESEPEVTATEDLMREHGVIRRALLVYTANVSRLQQGSAKVDAAALRQVAQLFRTFGEDYHEKMLEEQHIFPIIRKQGVALQHYADVLIEQHNRGREVTDYVLAVTNSARISTAHAEPLAKVLEGFVLMYRNHAAREDTIVFPAWKKNFSNKQLDEISDQFEGIEHKMFGRDGFEDAERKIGKIEDSLGLADLAQFTPPPPPNP